MNINFKKTIVLFLLTITFSAFSQENTKIKENVTSKKSQPANNNESSNPLNFGYEKKVINGKEIYIKEDNKSKKLVITYIPKQN
jgi:uncharacterized membrane-anchored protein YitT (DUF2179 family)